MSPRVAGPKPEGPFENRTKCEARDDIAPPVRENYYAREGQPDRKRADGPAGAGRQRTRRRCQCSHVQRMAGGKSILTFAGKRDAMDMPDDRSTIRPGLVEQKFQTMGQQRRCDRDEQSMIADAPQRLAAPARSQPADSCQNQKDLLVSAPRQRARHLLRSRRSVASDRTCDHDIGPGRLDGDRKAGPAAKAPF